jgi:hypothetical protein
MGTAPGSVKGGLSRLLGLVVTVPAVCPYSGTPGGPAAPSVVTPL